MTRQAKLQIGLDIKPLREETKRAKQAIEELGRVKIDRGLKNQIKDIFGKQLQDDAKRYRMEIENVRTALRQVSSTDAFNATKAQAYINAISKLNQGLAQTNQLQRSMNSPMMGGGRGMGVGGMSGRSMLSNIPGGGLIRGATSALGAVGIGLGVSAAVSRQAELGRAGLDVRSLTGGSSVGGRSDYGFTRAERLDRGKSIASSSGRNMSTEQITKEVDRSEMLERSFGISGEAFSGGVSAAKKSGVSDTGKFVADAVGDAVAMKLEGSAIGDYLSSMSSYMESVSKGVSINQQSLRGFAAALGSMDFFKKDPGRIFDAIGQLESIFKGGGNEYQQLGTYQSIQAASMEQNGRGLTPAGADVRQMIGLFGGGEKDAENFRKAGMGDLADVVGIGGDKIMKEGLEREFATAKKAGGGDNQLAAQMFMRNTGLKSQAGLSVFGEMAGAGGKLDTKGIEKARKAMRSPEEVAEDNMKTFDGGVVKFAERIDELQNVVSRFVTEGVLKFVDSVDKMAKALGMFESDIAKLGVTIASFVALKSLFERISTGGSGGGGKGVGGGVAAVGTVAAGIMALPAAAALGDAIGKAMRAQLDEWTKGSWGKALDEFWSKWNKDDTEKEQGAAKHTADFFSKADAEGIPLNPTAATAEAEKLGTYEASLKEEGMPQAEIDEKVRAKMASRIGELKSRHERFTKFKKQRDGGPNEFEDDKELQRSRLEFRESGTLFGEDLPEAKARGGLMLLAKGGRSGSGTVGVSSINGWARGGPMGRDNIDAKMMGGEFVVNARDASHNMMALVHANAGGKIKPYADGGEVGDYYANGGEIAGTTSGGIDMGALNLALGGNVEATNMLTKTITQLAANGGIIKGHPRGAGGMRYGRA